MLIYSILIIIILGLFLYFRYFLNKKKKISLNSLKILLLAASKVDGNTNKFEQENIDRTIKLVIERTKIRLSSEDLEYNNDIENKFLDFTKDIKFSNDIVDGNLFPFVDTQIKNIINSHKDITIKSLVSLCGSDCSFHRNEESFINYVAKELKLKEKYIKNIIDNELKLIDIHIKEEARKAKEEEDRIARKAKEEKDRIAREKFAKEAALAKRIALEKAKKALIADWNIKMRNVNFPGWNESVLAFMSELFDFNIRKVLFTPNKQLSKSVPGITETKAKVLKKQISGEDRSNLKMDLVTVNGISDELAEEIIDEFIDRDNLSKFSAKNISDKIHGVGLQKAQLIVEMLKT